MSASCVAGVRVGLTWLGADPGGDLGPGRRRLLRRSPVSTADSLGHASEASGCDERR